MSVPGWARMYAQRHVIHPVERQIILCNATGQLVVQRSSEEDLWGLSTRIKSIQGRACTSVSHLSLGGQVSPEFEGVPGGPGIAVVVHQACPVAGFVHLHVLGPCQLGDIRLHEVCLEVVQHHDRQRRGGTERQHLVFCTKTRPLSKSS